MMEFLLRSISPGLHLEQLSPLIDETSNNSITQIF